MSFTGGKLKLKGVSDPSQLAAGVSKKKKKKPKTVAVEEAETPTAASQPKQTPDGTFLEPPPAEADRRTEAQKKHDEMLAKREKEMTKKLAHKSHRERIDEFNKYLSELSEHHDIPKVGPG